MDIPSSKFTTFVSEKAHEITLYILVSHVNFDSLAKQFCVTTLQDNMDSCRSATTPKSILVYVGKRFCEPICLPHAPNPNSCQVCGAALELPIDWHLALLPCRAQSFKDMCCAEATFVGWENVALRWCMQSFWKVAFKRNSNRKLPLLIWKGLSLAM